MFSPRLNECAYNLLQSQPTPPKPDPIEPSAPLEEVTEEENPIDPETVKDNDAPELSSDKKTDEIIGIITQ